MNELSKLLKDLRPYAEVIEEFNTLSDSEQVGRVGTRIEEVMREDAQANGMSDATAAMIVSTFVGYFIGTLAESNRLKFEQLIEANFAIASFEGLQK